MAGQGLFDILSAAGGHPVDRQGLNMGIATGQALNGLRSAQTEDSMAAARKSVDEAEAAEARATAMRQVSSKLTGMGIPAEQADALGTIFAAGGGNNFDTAATGLGAVQQQGARNKLGNAALLGSPEQTAAQQQLEGKVAPPVNIPNQYAVLPGQTAPQVNVSPMGAADIAEKSAQAQLNNMKGLHPELFRTNGQPIPDAAQESLAQAMAKGNLALPSLYAIGRNPSLATLAQRAFELNPSLTQADQNVSQHTENAFATGTQGKNIAAINTAVGHINTVNQLLQAWKDSGGDSSNPILSRVYQIIGTQTNNPAPSNLNAALQLLSPEISKSTVASGAGAEEERTAASKLVQSLTPDEAGQALSTYQDMLASRATALKQEYEVGGGKKNFLGNKSFLTPETLHALNLHPDAVANTVSPGNSTAPNAVAPPVPAAPPGGGPAPVPGPQKLPAYDTEAAARAAGHGSGDKVIIGGQTGTLD